MSTLHSVHTSHNGRRHTVGVQDPKFSASKFVQWCKAACVNSWLITKDDFFTFVVPNTMFGVCGALAGSTLAEHQSTFFDILIRTPLVVLFNWSNLLIFDLANQRGPEAVKEDAINKPWRVIPSGRLTSNDVRQIMLFLIPTILAINYLLLRVGIESAVLVILTWLYNDLGGGEHWKTRDGIIAVAFGVYNTGSLKTAAGSVTMRPSINNAGWSWVATISAVIFTTMTVQDLKDQAGDRARGRRTAPIVLGDIVARKFIATSVTLWSCFCFWFWTFKLMGIAAMTCGAVVAWRCLNLSGNKADRRTWELWAFWLMVLYCLPCL